MQISSNLHLRLRQSAPTLLLVGSLSGEIDVRIACCNYAVVHSEVAPGWVVQKGLLLGVRKNA